MSKPLISTNVAGGYVFTWAEERITIHVSRIGVHRDKVSGEVIIRTDAEGFSPVLHPPTNFNFSSERGRKELIKSLTEKYNSKWDWQGIIDQLCCHVPELARQGEPVHEKWIHDIEIKPPEYLLNPFVLKGSAPTIIFGEKGSAKSTVAGFVYISLTLPWRDNPLGLTTCHDPIKTLYLDYETDFSLVSWNLKRLQNGMEMEDVPTFPVCYRRCYLPLADDLEQLKQIIVDGEYQAVIIDSLAQACGGELRDAQPALRFFSALRQLNVSSLIIAQTAKNELGSRSVYGSTFFEYYVRSVFEIRKAEGDGEDDLNIGVCHKVFNLGKLHAPIGFNLKFSNDAITIQKSDLNKIPDFEKRRPLKYRVLETLKRGGMDANDLVEELQVKRNSIDQTLRRLGNKVVKIEGKWFLTTNREDQN